MPSRKTEQTADLLHSAAIRLLRYVRKEDAASGITGAQLSVLSVLVFAGPQTLGALAQASRSSRRRCRNWWASWSGAGLPCAARSTAARSLCR